MEELTVTYNRDPQRYMLPDPNEPAEPIVIDEKERGPIRLVRERISRNGPCFCGSGQKFKRCCIRVYADVPVVRSEG